MSAKRNLTLSDVEAMVARLSQRKEPTVTKTEPKREHALPKGEIEKLFNRLATFKKPQSPPLQRRKNGSGLSNKDIDELFERLSKQKRPASPLPVNRGEARSQMDIDNMVARLSLSKKSQEDCDKKESSSGPKMSKNDIAELVARLSNKEVAMEKTPDTKRVMDKKYGIVSSYAWNGCNHQAILCNEESP